MKTTIILLYLVCLILTIACKKDESDKSDKTLPVIVSSIPADGTVKVSILSKIDIIFSEDLDSTTVNETNIVLKTKSNTSITRTLTYNDAGKKITVTPSRPLTTATSYKCTLSGIKDASGNEMASQTFTFRTFVNPQIKYVYYTGGNVSLYYIYTLDSNGNKTQSIYYNGAGDDTIWFNGDDVINNKYEAYTYDAKGNMINRIYYKGAGADTSWLTNDDIVDNYYTNIYDVNCNRTRYIAYSGAGINTTWFDDDDVVSYYGITTYDENGNEIQSTSYSGAGTDTDWFSGDDVISSISYCDTTL